MSKRPAAYEPDAGPSHGREMSLEDKIKHQARAARLSARFGARAPPARPACRPLPAAAAVR